MQTTPKCPNCKSKNTRHRRTRNGKEQFQCKDCERCFTVQPKEEKDVCFVKEKRKEEYIFELDRCNIACGLASEISDMHTRLEHADEVNLANVKFMQEVREENANLYNRVQRRNVVIYMLVAILTLASIYLFLSI